ncbi:MAG: hypothetical protein ACMUHX_03850 [bacterium]
MNKYKFAIIMTIFFALFVSAAMVFSAIDPGTWYYQKTVNLTSEETALISFPQATSDNGESNHDLIGNPDNVNSLFENEFTNGQSGIFYLYYSGDETIDEEILMIALKEYDDYFFLSLRWQINSGAMSQNIQLESADFNTNEYGYFPQWWKVAQSGKPLISTGSDQDEYYVVYVKLGFNGQVMQDGDILSIKYALSNFDAPGSRLVFNVYGSSNNEDSFRWTNKNTNTFGINSTYSSTQQNSTFFPYLYGGLGGYYPYSGIFSGYGGWGFTSPASSIYGAGLIYPFSFIGGGYGGNYGFSPGYWGSFSGYGGYSPFNNYYQGYFGLYGWSSPNYGFSGSNYGGYFSGFGSYSPYSRYYPGSYYGNYGSFYPYV